MKKTLQLVAKAFQENPEMGMKNLFSYLEEGQDFWLYLKSEINREEMVVVDHRDGFIKSIHNNNDMTALQVDQKVYFLCLQNKGEVRVDFTKNLLPGEKVLDFFANKLTTNYRTIILLRRGQLRSAPSVPRNCRYPKKGPASK